MSDSARSSSQDALPPHEQLETCLKNLFEVPTKSVESAFELVLGLIKEQSSQIDGVKRAHAEALKDTENVRTSMQNVVDELAREKDELSADFQELKRKHNDLLQSHEKTTEIVDGLKHEIETLTFNFLGDNGDQADQAVDGDTETEHAGHEMEVDGNITKPQLSSENAKEGESQQLGWGEVGRIGLAKVKIARMKLNADHTVAARLDRLEESLSSLPESLSSVRQPNDQSNRTKIDETLEEISSRIHAVETFLRGFECDASSSVEGEEAEHPTSELSANDEHDNASEESDPVEAIAYEDGPDQNSSADNSGTSSKSRKPSRRGTLLSLLNERETKTGLTMDDLAQQLSALRKNMQGQPLDVPHDIDREEVQKQIAELSDGLKRQVADLEASVSNKVSNEDFEATIQDMRNILSNCHAAETTNSSSGSSASSNIEIQQKVNKLETTKLDKDTFEQQLEQMEHDLKSLLDQEISKQQLDVSANAEKTDNDLIEIKSILDSQQDAILQLRDETPLSASMDSSLKEDEVNARIQQATDDLRVSLEERLDELRSIESEMDGFASKLAEKPSQDQIDSMLCDLENRLGQDEELQILLANMKIELKQRMTKGEVVALVKHTFKEAKLGIQNTKDTLMIGRIPYCLGCSQPFPTGVNGMRAPKMNHDSLPPALGLVSNATLYGTGGRRSLRPLQALRSAPQRARPKSAILGRFSASSAHVRARNNSR